MSDDIHICGTCKNQFHSLQSFIDHKKVCSKPNAEFPGTIANTLENGTVLGEGNVKHEELANRQQASAVLSPNSEGSGAVEIIAVSFANSPPSRSLDDSLEGVGLSVIADIERHENRDIANATTTTPLPRSSETVDMQNSLSYTASLNEAENRDDNGEKSPEDVVMKEKSSEAVVDVESVLEQPIDLSGGNEMMPGLLGNVRVICGPDGSMSVVADDPPPPPPPDIINDNSTVQPLPETNELFQQMGSEIPIDGSNMSPKYKPIKPKDKPLKILTVAPKKFICKTCNKGFQHRKDLDRHYRMHTGDKPYSCQFCFKKFARTDKRKIHERVHTGDKPYKCPHCTYATTDSTNLKKHVFIHTGEKPYRCQLCDYRCRNSNQLTVHIRTHTGDAPYVCYICKYAFKVKSDLTRHLFIHSGEKPFSCSLCDYKCTLKSNLKSHERINHDPNNMQVCKMCGYKTSSKKNFQSHTATAHGSLKCQKCNFTAKDENDLELHLMLHTGQKTYQCSMCSYSSDRSQAVKNHVQKKHPKQLKPVIIRTPGRRQLPKEIDGRMKQLQAQCKKKFQCHKCDAAFVKEDSLGCHLRNHTETEKIVAMAVLDLQRPVVVPGTSAASADNSMASPGSQASTSGTAVQTDNQFLDVDDYLNNSSTINSNISNITLQHEGDETRVVITSPNNSAGTSNSGANRVTRPHEASHYSAVLSQAASNLLAFMQNNQNKAVEENIINTAVAARQTQSVTTTTSSAASTIVASRQQQQHSNDSNTQQQHLNSHGGNHNIRNSMAHQRMAQQQNNQQSNLQTDSSASNMPSHHIHHNTMNIDDSVNGSLNRGVHQMGKGSQINNPAGVSCSSSSNTGGMVEFNQASSSMGVPTSMISSVNNSIMSIASHNSNNMVENCLRGTHSPPELHNTGMGGSGNPPPPLPPPVQQSSWEHLQQAVLHSVSLQSSGGIQPPNHHHPHHSHLPQHNLHNQLHHQHLLHSLAPPSLHEVMTPSGLQHVAAAAAASSGATGGGYKRQHGSRNPDPLRQVDDPMSFSTCDISNSDRIRSSQHGMHHSNKLLPLQPQQLENSNFTHI